MRETTWDCGYMQASIGPAARYVRSCAAQQARNRTDLRLELLAKPGINALHVPLLLRAQLLQQPVRTLLSLPLLPVLPAQPIKFKPYKILMTSLCCPSCHNACMGQTSRPIPEYPLGHPKLPGLASQVLGSSIQDVGVGLLHVP